MTTLAIDPGTTETERKADRAAYAREYRRRNPGDKRKGCRSEYSKNYRRTEGYKKAQEKYRSSEKFSSTNSAYLHRERETNPQILRAREAVRSAIKSGRLIKPSSCSKCSRDGLIHGHHTNYSRALEVVWLCPKCHTKEHLLSL